MHTVAKKIKAKRELRTSPLWDARFSGPYSDIPRKRQRKGRCCQLQPLASLPQRPRNRRDPFRMTGPQYSSPQAHPKCVSQANSISNTKTTYLWLRVTAFSGRNRVSYVFLHDEVLDALHEELRAVLHETREHRLGLHGRAVAAHRIRRPARALRKRPEKTRAKAQLRRIY